MTLGATVPAVLLLALVAVPSSGFERSLIDLLDAVPDWLDLLWRLGIAAVVIWSGAVVVVALLRRRIDVLIDVVAASLVALALGAVTVQQINGSWPNLRELTTGGPSGTIPLAALGVLATVDYAAAAHLTRPYRRFGDAVVLSGALSAAILSATTPVGATISLLLGAAAASIVHLLLGTADGCPDPQEVTDALLGMGVSAVGLTEQRAAAGGAVLMEGATDAGLPLRVKVYGRDARDARLVARACRTLWYRGAGSTPGSRVQLVEHEAFVTLLAATRGIPVPAVLVAGVDHRNDALLAVSDGAEPLSAVDRAVADQVLGGVWEMVTALHDIGIAHRDISSATVGIIDGEAAFRDLGSATLLRSEADVLSDHAQTLVATAVTVGIERAVLAAGAHLGSDGVEAMLPYLQVAALSRPLRRELKSAAFDMDALRSAAAGFADVEVPELAKLQRVSPQSLVTAGLLALVAFALITSLAGVDLDELWDTLSGASPGWVIAALLVAQTPFVSQAVATRGATPRAVPLGPLTLMQSGIAFIALAVPSTAGRLALDIRFFQRLGVPATTAVSISAIDSFSGFLVQVSLLVLTLGFGLGGVEMSFGASSKGTSSSSLPVVLAVLAGLLLLAVVIAVALPVIRARIVAKVSPVLTQVRDTLRSLRSVTKLLELFGGNLANQLLYAAALGLCLEAFGGHLDLATLVVVYVAAALFGGIMPVPGGIGVVVAALTAGFVAAGVDTTTATAAAILFRTLTFYLPPLWGWASLRWLRQHAYL